MMVMTLMLMINVDVDTMQGSVEFVQSNEFRIEVNAESSSVEQLARFHYNFTDFHGSLLLQMV